MNEKQNKIGFFSVELNQVDQMVRAGAGSAEVIVYLVLARGLGAKKASRWGMKSCANYTGLTYHRAAKASDWLQEKGFIKDISEGRKRQWVFSKSEHGVPVYLSNALIEGIGAGKENPPMNRLHNDLKMGEYGGREEAKLDTLMVLLHLYRHQSLRDFGGVNPASGLFKEWSEARNHYGSHAEEVTGSNAVIYEIKGEPSTVYTHFMSETLFYVEDETERQARFWAAFENLSRLGWLYETTQVWSDDPRKNSRAEPLYTLYVHDKHARDTDPYLVRDVHKVAAAVDPDFWWSVWSEIEEWGNLSVGFNQQFRYIAPKGKGFPIGIYRLRFRPHTEDTGKGMTEEQHRVDEWRQHCSRLRKNLESVD